MLKPYEQQNVDINDPVFYGGNPAVSEGHENVGNSIQNGPPGLVSSGGQVGVSSTAIGNEPMGKTVQAPEVAVTGERLPSVQHTSTIEPGIVRSPEDQRTARTEDINNQKSAFYSDKANINKPFNPDRMAANSHSVHRPGVVNETTKDLITGKSITQTGFEGYDKSADEIADMSGFSAQHKEALARARKK